MTELKQFIKSRCYDFGTLYSLEEQFNNIGLTIQSTCGGDMVLCKLVKGKPIAESLGTDHIFVGVQSRPRERIPHKLVKCVLEFISAAGGTPDRLSQTEPHPRTGHTGLYGSFMVEPVVQDMALGGANIGDNLLEAIKEWCDAQV